MIMQGLRVRVTANAVSITSIDSRHKAEFEQLNNAIKLQAEETDHALQSVGRLVADTNETMLATATKLVQFEEDAKVTMAAVSGLEDQQHEATSALSIAEQSLRIQLSKLEERLNKRVSFGHFEVFL